MDKRSEYLSDKNIDNNAKYYKKILFNKAKEHQRLFLLDRWRYFKGYKKILDAGCGRCAFIKTNPGNHEVFGIDRDKVLVEEAQKQGLNVKLANLNKKLPFKDNSFDAIGFFHVLEHFDDPSNVIKEFKRVLRNEGKLVIIVPNFSFKHFYDGYTHRRPYTKTSLLELLNDFDFKNIKIENGVNYSRTINILFGLFPGIRLAFKKIIGKIFPSEFIAIAINKKG